MSQTSEPELSPSRAKGLTSRQAFLIGVGVTLAVIASSLVLLSQGGRHIAVVDAKNVETFHHPPLSAHSIPSYAPSGHHPSIDCQKYTGEIEPEADSKKIDSLGKELEGETVKVKAFVVGAFYGIMNTNWYQLCDTTRGDVLVVQSDNRIARQQVVTVTGKITFDQQIARAYNFEKLIVDGVFPGAKKLRRPPPEGITEL